MKKQVKQLVQLAQICANFDITVELSRRIEVYSGINCKVQIYNNDNHNTHEITFWLVNGTNTKPIEVSLYSGKITFPIDMPLKSINELISFLIPFINETFVINSEEIARKIKTERMATIETLEKELEQLKALN